MEASIPSEPAAARVPEMLAAVEAATHRIVGQLPEQRAAWWDEPSDLPGWTRRTVLAHLHYGAQASTAVTMAALDGRSEAFYPGGIDQRARTLQAFDHRPMGLVAWEVIEQAERLAATWAALSESDWATEVVEPRLGRITLARFVALRLCEVEVHGHDLGLGSGWSDCLVSNLLPLRVAWLPQLRFRPDAERNLRRSWLLSGDADAWVAQVDGDGAEVTVATGADTPTHRIGGSDRSLLAALLGRETSGAPLNGSLAANPTLAAFKRAFPGP